MHTVSSKCKNTVAKTVSIRLYTYRLSRAKIRVVKNSGEYLRIGVWENRTQRWIAGGWNDDGIEGEGGFVDGVARLEDVDLKPDKEVGETWLVVDNMVNEELNTMAGERGKGGFEATILSDNMVKFWGEWIGN
jgi:hypothetical protein